MFNSKREEAQEQKPSGLDLSIVKNEIENFKKKFGIDLSFMSVEDYVMKDGMANSQVRGNSRSTAAVESGREVRPLKRVEIVDALQKLNTPYVIVATLKSNGITNYFPMVKRGRIPNPVLDHFNKIVNNAISLQALAFNCITHWSQGVTLQLGTVDMSNEMATSIYTTAGKLLGMPGSNRSTGGDELAYGDEQ